MKIMLSSLLAAAAAAAAGGIAAAGHAETPVAAASSMATAPAQGSTVYDQSGAVVGTIESVDGQFATLATTKSKVKLPLSSFGTSDKGPLLAMSAAQVDAAAAAAAPTPAPTQAAAVPPKLSAGVAVSDTAGKPVGKIEAVDGQFATLATANTKVRLPVSAFASGATGPMIAMSAAELEAAAAGAGAKTDKN